MYLAKNKRLLLDFKAGTRESMDEIYRHYKPGLYAFLRKGFSFRSERGSFFFKGINEPSDLDAAVQEVFRRAFEERARTSYNGINSFTNWVLAIARNMMINQFRNREVALSSYVGAGDPQSHLTFMDNEMTEEFSGLLYGRHKRDQVVETEHGELKGLIDRFMGELTEEDRQILSLRFIDGKGQEEVAELLNSTRMKIRTAESKLRSRLRAFLRHSGYIDTFRSRDKTVP